MMTGTSYDLRVPPLGSWAIPGNSSPATGETAFNS